MNKAPTTREGRRSRHKPLTSVLVLVWPLLAAACLDGPTSPSDGVTTGLLPIERIETVVQQSDPPQVTLRVRGWLADSCTSLGDVTRRAEANTVIVTITTKRSGEVCAQVISPVSVDVPLPEIRQSGEYLAIVNGVEHRFRV